MRILYISQYFPPEVGATQTRAIEMASNLVRQGHQVTVLTEFPNHPKGIIPEKYRGKFIEHDRVQGVDVIRTWVYARPDKTFFTRMGFYLSFMFTSFIVGLFLRGKFDIVYATSPPFFVGVSGLLSSRLKSARFVFEVRDLWPQSAVELGELSNETFIRWAEGLENVYYKKADILIAVTKGIYRHLSARGYGAKVRQVLNGTNTELFYYRGGEKKSEMGWDNKFVVLYAGILGIAQGMEKLCDLVENCKAYAEIQFVFIGEGPQKEKVKQLQETKKLHNLLLLGEVPREIIPEYISAADCCLVPLKKNPLFLGALPSKMFDYMACERPVILSVDGEARRVLEASGGGIYVEPENTQQMEEAILHLKNSPALCRKMGRAGREYVMQNFSRRQKALELEKILLEL